MAENEVEEGEEKKSSKKIIIIAAVILLLVGGGAGYYFMAGDSEQTEGEQTEESESNDEEGDQVSAEVFYFDLEKPLIVNFPKGSAARLIQVSVSLSVEGEEVLEALKKHQPMIRNNLLMKISAKGAEGLKGKEGKQALREDMLKEVSEIMEKMTGKNTVTNVFFTTFVMQ